VLEAGQSAPGSGLGGVAVLTSGGEEGGTTRGGGGSPKWAAGVDLRQTGHQWTGTPARRGGTASERHGARRRLPAGEAHGGVARGGG
jgi:hypothetical protein